MEIPEVSRSVPIIAGLSSAFVFEKISETLLFFIFLVCLIKYVFFYVSSRLLIYFFIQVRILISFEQC